MDSGCRLAGVDVLGIVCVRAGEQALEGMQQEREHLRSTRCFCCLQAGRQCQPTAAVSACGTTPKRSHNVTSTELQAPLKLQ